jgi:precorrin-2 dehydrogenase/sirohydrochlorin ferrochelatase
MIRRLAEGLRRIFGRRSADRDELAVHVDYPACLRLEGKRILVVGGGAIAAQRCADLVRAGASLEVIAPELSRGILDLARSGRLQFARRDYESGDVHGHDVVFIATTDPDLSRMVAAEARALGIWVNAADQPELCDFTLPSVGRRGPITVAVSTAGTAPALAARLRRELLAHVGPEHVVLAHASARLRRLLPPGNERMQVLRDLVAADSKQEIA